MKPKLIRIKNIKPTYEELTDMVGGYLEFVWDNGNIQIICNEEGKFMQLPYNREATELWVDLIKDNNGVSFYEEVDCLVGNVVVLEGEARLS